MVVAVLGETGQSHLRLAEAGEALAIEDLCCSTPQKASILPFVQGELSSVRRLDAEVAQALTEKDGYAGHPGHPLII